MSHYDIGRKTVKLNKYINQDKYLNVQQKPYRWLMRKIKHDALPSDDTALQIFELDELPKATGVVIL